MAQPIEQDFYSFYQQRLVPGLLKLEVYRKLLTRQVVLFLPIIVIAFVLGTYLILHSRISGIWKASAIGVFATSGLVLMVTTPTLAKKSKFYKHYQNLLVIPSLHFLDDHVTFTYKHHPQGEFWNQSHFGNPGAVTLIGESCLQTNIEQYHLQIGFLDAISTSAESGRKSKIIFRGLYGVWDAGDIYPDPHLRYFVQEDAILASNSPQLPDDLVEGLKQLAKDFEGNVHVTVYQHRIYIGIPTEVDPWRPFLWNSVLDKDKAWDMVAKFDKLCGMLKQLHEVVSHLPKA